MADLSALRREYEARGLDEKDVASDPIAQFDAWFGEAHAAGVREPNAMTLATLQPDGAPGARVVLLKGFDERGFLFYTNYASAKASAIEHDARVALVFLWLPLERQVRVAGRAERTSPEESAAYFRTRPRGAQLGAWASAQSTAVQSRAALEASLAELEAEYEGGREVPLPPFWGGYRVLPTSVEFWQGRPSRLHDRIRYVKEGPAWRIERLAP